MTAAWLHAGARCVVASAAAINDEVAHDVLVRVHEGLADGHRPAAALARALLDVDPTGRRRRWWSSAEQTGWTAAP